MTTSERLFKVQRWLRRIAEDRLDQELATQVMSRNEPMFSIEEVSSILRLTARTRHRKPRKID
jgi:hypothetical protein